MRVRPLSPRVALFCDSRVPEEDRDELRLAATTVTRALADMLTPLTNPGTLQPGKAGRSGPNLGREMWVVPGFEALTDRRSINFDAPSRKGKPRYRIVYRNEPDGGSIAVICVLAAGERNQMTADKQARARLKARLRREE